jgi:DNA-binding MarR family transcriptional regulator
MMGDENGGHPYGALQRVFHEPNRLAIMSALGGAVNGLSFRELRDQCRLTDGNLNRHLKTLEEASAVRIHKRFVGARPRTTVHLTDAGRQEFVAYLQALEEVFLRAAEAMEVEERGLSLFGKVSDTAQV